MPFHETKNHYTYVPTYSVLTKIVGALKAKGCESDESMSLDLTVEGPDPRFLRVILCRGAGLVDLYMVRKYDCFLAMLSRHALPIYLHINPLLVIVE